MNKLPTSKQKGFTLVEIMVAITIIAVLAAVGIVVFGGVQKQARDSKRSQDLDALATAFEGKKQPGSILYSALTTSEFTGGTFTKDPKDPDQKYCLWGKTDVPPVAPLTQAEIAASWTTYTGCGAVTGATYQEEIKSGMTMLDSDSKQVTSWTICAKLEANTGIICKTSKL